MTQKIFSFIQSALSEGRKALLMSVINRDGSSPGKQGFKLAVDSDGRFTGSIGGGVMEHRLVEQARRILKQDKLPLPYIVFQNHDPEAKENRSGMICSGGQTIAFVPLTDNELHEVNRILNGIKKEEKGILKLSEKGLTYTPGTVMDRYFQSEVLSENKWVYSEQTGMPPTVFIFGGGHVGLALSKVFRPLGFKIHIFDNRSGLNTMEQNHDAHVKHIVDYRHVGSLVPEGFNVYAIVVTFAHKSDEQVLEQLFNKKIKYLGMMGSAKKIETIFDHLKEKGVPEEELSKVHAPIGLTINSETPAEIAISIAAEVIAVKNGAKR